MKLRNGTLFGTVLCCAGLFVSDAWAGNTELCDATIQINALRGGSPTVSIGGTKRVTSKARLEKGTGPADQTLDQTSLIIEAYDGEVLIDSQMSSKSLTLVLGKGGQGDTLTLSISQCDSGSIDFVATFAGVSSTTCSAGPCGLCIEESRKLNKTCN